MMLSFQNLSIRRKQMLIIMLTSTVALLLACVAFVGYDVWNFRRELVERIGGIAEVIAEHSTASLDFSDPKTAEQTLHALSTEPDVVSGCIYDRDGHVFARYEREPGAAFVAPLFRRDGFVFTGNRLHLFRPITAGGETIGTIYVESDLQELPRRIGKYLEIAGLVFGISLLAALVLSSRLQRVLSNPILHLARIARSVAEEKNYSLRAQKQSSDELGQLIENFNEMLAQIQERDDAVQAARDTLERSVEARTNELARSLSLLNATLNSTADGILAIDFSGRIICYNEKYASIWNIPHSILLEGDGEKMIRYCATQCENPAGYIKRIEDLHVDLQVDPRVADYGVVEVLSLKGGRAVERVIHPQLLDGKHVGVVVTVRDITERRKAEANLQKANSELVQASRMAGMAEVATNVLHNVGNVLNSVNTSASIVADQVRASRVNGISKVVDLLEPNVDKLGTFLSHENRGRQVVNYLKSLAGFLGQEQAAMAKELNGLTKNIEHIKQIVAMQQSYAKASGVEEIHAPAALLEDALRIHIDALQHQNVRIVRKFEKTPDIVADKHKVLQILINLIGNAKYALVDAGNQLRELTLAMTAVDADRIRISVTDNGVGIAPENLIRIFSHGFTTRKTGHGFGLHGGFLAAKEMGGSLSVHSDGPGKGATFTLELPVNARGKQ